MPNKDLWSRITALVRLEFRSSIRSFVGTLDQWCSLKSEYILKLSFCVTFLSGKPPRGFEFCGRARPWPPHSTRTTSRQWAGPRGLFLILSGSRFSQVFFVVFLEMFVSLGACVRLYLHICKIYIFTAVESIEVESTKLGNNSTCFRRLKTKFWINCVF